MRYDHTLYHFLRERKKGDELTTLQSLNESHTLSAIPATEEVITPDSRIVHHGLSYQQIHL